MPEHNANAIEHWEYFNLLENTLNNINTNEYTGIGARRQTKKNFRLLVRIGMLMSYRNYTLRSGGAYGSDEAFELGIYLWLRLLYNNFPDNQLINHQNFENKYYNRFRKIYLPYNRFRDRYNTEPGVLTPNNNDEARKITNKYHPNKNLNERFAVMMDRNANQILGDDLKSLTKGVICHTPDGADGYNIPTNYNTGGTGHAIRIAHDYGVPIENIGNKDTFNKWLSILDKFDNMLENKFNTNSKIIVDEYLDNYIGFDVVYSDLVKNINETNDLDIMVHGCNCFCTMGSGIAASVKETFPEAYEIDLKQTTSGDKKKLGTYTFLNTKNNIGKDISIINAYTQYKYGKVTEDMQEPFVDYEKLRLAFKSIDSNFKNKVIGIPMIGAGLAGGEWYIIARIIKETVKNSKIILYKI